MFTAGGGSTDAGWQISRSSSTVGFLLRSLSRAQSLTALETDGAQTFWNRPKRTQGHAERARCAGGR